MFETAEGGSTEREEACQSQPNGPSGPQDGDGGDDDGDIYIMMQCLFVCLSRKMSTSSWESPVTT